MLAKGSHNMILFNSFYKFSINLHSFNIIYVWRTIEEWFYLYIYEWWAVDFFSSLFMAIVYVQAKLLSFWEKKIVFHQKYICNIHCIWLIHLVPLIPRQNMILHPTYNRFRWNDKKLQLPINGSMLNFI
jgi:hypothetical protein